MDFDESLAFDALYESMWKCKRGKMYKASVARLVIHGIEEILRLEEENKNGTYKPRRSHSFMLTYPKERSCSSIHIRDRIVQRSLNDNVIYPAMTRSFVWDNMACQKGKGTTRAMDRLNTLLHRYYINNGGSNEGYVFQFDIHGYYRNMSHRIAQEVFSRHLDDKTVSHCMSWLSNQYPGDTGYEPGSQMVQILGISYLDVLDHKIKEQLKAKYYLRYMDDGLIISENKEFLEKCKNLIDLELKEIGLELHPNKSRIYRISEGIKVLGFTFRLTSTGKIVRIIDPKNVKHERKKLVRMANLVKLGRMTKEKFYECYKAWKAHAMLGNSFLLLQRMDRFVKTLLEEDKCNDQCSAKGNRGD